MPEDGYFSHAAPREGKENRMTIDAPSTSQGPGVPAMTSRIEAAPEAGFMSDPRPLLQKVMQDLAQSWGDLKDVGPEVAIQAEAGPAPGAEDPDRENRAYRDLFEFAPDGYLVTDARTIIQAGNQAAAAMLQLDPDSLKGKPLPDFIAAADRAAFQANLIQLREGGVKRDWELRLQSGDRTPFAVFINVRAQTDSHDNLVRMLWLLRNAKERQVEEENLKSLLIRIKSSLQGIIESFAEAVEMKDPQTAGHQRRVAQLAVALAREMDFSLNRLAGIKVAALLHDIGKIAIPTEVLSKPGELTDLECEMIKSHCQVGADLLKEIDFPWPVSQAILQHHERLDGSGYPAGLTDADIILEARILGVADVVEAMICDRTYGPAQGIDKALDEIFQKMGILYDPEVVNICIKLFVDQGFGFN